jgi:Protein of unknown function (DUF998)
MTMSRRAAFACTALVGAGLTLLLAVLGQFGPDPDFSQVSLTVSDYAVADRGGVTDWAMLMFGGSALALLFTLERPRRLVSAILALFATAMVIAAIAPTDDGMQLTLAGSIHRYASVAAFAALPTAGLLLAARFGRLAGLIRGLVGASSVFMLAMLGSATLADRGGIGVAERLLLLTGVILLGVLAFGALRSAATAIRCTPWQRISRTGPTGT